MDIKYVIKKHGFSLSEVARRIGKTPQTLFGIIENGNPSIKTLELIAHAIGADTEEFFCSHPKEPEINAMIEYKGSFYKANTINELKEIIKTLESL